MLLYDKNIDEMRETLIKPFNKDKLGSVNYDLTVETFSDEPREESVHVSLAPGQSAFVKSVEEITLPNNIVARIHLRNSRIRQGLLLTAPIYYPGHETKVFYRITNVSQNTIELNKGDGVASITFERLENDVENPYSGTFQKEFDFRGMADYKSEYSRNIIHIDKKVEDIKNTERRMYGNVLAIMAIFVGIFSLININMQNAHIHIKSLLSLDLATVGSIAFLIAAISTALHMGKNRVILWIVCVAAFAVSILIQI